MILVCGCWRRRITDAFLATLKYSIDLDLQANFTIGAELMNVAWRRVVGAQAISQKGIFLVVANSTFSILLKGLIMLTVLQHLLEFIEVLSALDGYQGRYLLLVPRACSSRARFDILP